MTDVDLPQDEEPSTKTITDGYFEEELHIDARSAGEFLIKLGEQLKAGDEVTITGDGWRIPFAFSDHVELEIEFEGSEPELEIEIELTGRQGSDQPPQVQ